MFDFKSFYASAPSYCKSTILYTVKPIVRGHSKRRPKLVIKTGYHLMQVKSIAECSSAILWTFIKLPFGIKTFVLSIFEWQLKTGFTVHNFHIQNTLAAHLWPYLVIFTCFFFQFEPHH